VAVAMVLVFVVANLNVFEITLSSIIDYVLRLGIAVFFVLLLDFVIAKNDLTKKNSYGILVLLLGFAVFPETLKHGQVMLSGLFVFFATRRLLSLHTKRQIKKKCFDAAFWIGLATLCYTWAILFFIVVILAVMYYWQNDIKNIAVTVFGLLCVLILLIIYNIICYDAYVLPSNFDFSTSFEFSNYLNASFGVALSIVGLLYLWSLVYFFKHISETKKNRKPVLILVLVLSFVALLLTILSSEKNGSTLIFFLAPFSIIVANYLERITANWLREGLVVLVILTALLRLVL